jgi:PAS domain S-box-containing protein
MPAHHKPARDGLSEIQFDPAMLDDFPGLVWGTRPDGSVCYYNKAALGFCGLKSLTAVKGGWHDRVHPEDREQCIATTRAAFEKREPFQLEFRMRRHDGEWRWIVDRGAPMWNARGEITGYLGVAHDITERRQADFARRESEEQVRLLGMITHDMIWNWDVRLERVIHNAAYIATLGEPPASFHEKSAWWKTRVHPDDLGRITAAFDNAVNQGYASVSYEYRILDRTARYITIDERISLLRDHASQLTRVLCAMRDITNRKRAEEAEARMVRILEATTDFVGITSVDGEIHFINAAGRKMLGIPSDAPLNLRIPEVHPEWANEIVLKEAIPLAVRDGDWRGETALLHRDGHEIPVSQVLLAHGGADGKVEFLSTIMRDLSEQKREEVARIEWANRYDAAIRASRQVLFDWNSFTNEITYAGDIERLFGYTMAEMAGGLATLRRLIHPADLEGFDSELQRVTVTRDPFQREFRVRQKGGAYAFIEAKGYFFLDRRGQIGRMVGFFADVTSQRHAQEALARAHESLEARVEERTAELARAYIVIQDRALQQEAVAHLGQQALGGASLHALLDEAASLVRTILHVDYCTVLELIDEGQVLLARAQTGWPQPQEFNRVPIGVLSQSGYTLLKREPVIVEDTASETRFQLSDAVVAHGVRSSVSVVIEAGESPLGVLCAFSREKRSFVQDDVHFLQSIANVLTTAIQRQRAEDSVRQAREQAEAANRTKSEFLSRMSHELRTPLNAILGFTQLLELDEPSESQAESIAHITRAGKHLLSLINEVLDIARIESGRLALESEPVAIASFLRDVMELVRPLAARHQIEISLDRSSAQFPGHVLADRQRLKQVMLNLLSNAVKYNRRGGSVTIRAAIDGSNVRISVADTGIGIASEKIGRLFLPFERLGAEATDIEGTGIGLALSRGIVEALGGNLTAESIEGKGSVFSFTLPRTEEPAQQAAAPPTSAQVTPAAQPAAGTAPSTLLYIEDQDLNLRLVERILNPHRQYRLLTAMQGGIGLDLAREHAPDLILLDLNLPDMSGDEVLRRLKSDPAVRHIPVLMVSADAMNERIEQLMQLGATGYLTKPYKVAEFLRVIAETVGRH